MHAFPALLVLLSAVLAPGPGRTAVPGSTAASPATASPRILQLDGSSKLSKPDRASVFEEYVLAFRAAVTSSNEARQRELAEHAVLVFPELRRPWCHLAAARLRIHLWGPAIEAARTAEKARDDDDAPSILPNESAAGAAYWEGLALYQTQRFAEALPRLRLARQRAPEWAEAARALGEAEFVAGHAKEAAAAYAAAFALDPAVGTAADLSYWAEAQTTTGDVAGGIAALQEALRLAPYEPGLHAKLGDLLRREGEPAEAYYQLVYEGILQGFQGPFTTPAVSMAQAIVDGIHADTQRPDEHELQSVSAALASLDAGEPHLAIHQLQHALAITRSASPVPRLLLADALYRDQQFEPSRAVLQELLETNRDLVPALELLSDVYSKLGRPRDSEATLQRATSLFPGYWKLDPKNRRS